MALNGSGIRDTARVLKINKNTIIGTLKKAPRLTPVNPCCATVRASGGGQVRVAPALEAELDEQWSFVGNKTNPRWL
jgi:hypothetical protein